MNYGYIYKITYLDEKSHLYNCYYYGMRTYKNNEALFDFNDPTYYHGSSARAIREYWPFYNEHKKEIICWCDNIDELRQKESEIIALHINEPMCINCQIGGSGNPFEGKSEEYIDNLKIRISESLKQTYKDKPELLRKMSESRKGKPSPNKGKPCSEEIKKKLSLAHKGRPTWNKGLKDCYSEEWKEKQRIAHLGLTHTLSEETKQKIREANKIAVKEYYKTHDGPNKGKKMSEEQKEKLRISHLGKHLSEEHKKKIGDTQRGIPKGPMSEEHKNKISLSHRGKSPSNKGQLGVLKWVNNDIESKMVPINEIEHYLSLGYKKGRGQTYIRK